MANPEPIRINVAPTNPGQFFACCGLFELAARLWREADGWFEKRQFCIACSGTLPELVREVSQTELIQLDPSDQTGSAICIGQPFGLRLDWWHDDRAGGKELKVWAGAMESFRIHRAMQQAMRKACFQSPDLLDVGLIVYDPDNPEKKVEPFYFDARRGPNAHSRDVGFAPNDLQLTTTASPAVEFFCLVGLQRCLPAPTGRPRVFDYYTWGQALPPELMPAAVSGFLSQAGLARYRFENWYRTGQRKHKAFRFANPLSKGE